MFDIGFAELIIIGVVALIVIGPERLPGAIRTGSAWLNRLRRGFNDIKQEVQQELHNDAVMRDLRESGEALRKETDTLRKQLKSPLTDLDSDTPPLPTRASEQAAEGLEDRAAGESEQAAAGEQTDAPEKPRD